MTPPPDRPAPDAETLRQRLKKVRRRLQNTERRLERAERQLDALREFSFDVFPGTEVPDRVAKVIDTAREQNLTYLSEQALRSLVVCVLETEASGRAGLMIEAGTALGGSAIAMAAAKDPARPMRVYDMFGQIPPPSGKDGEDVLQRYETIAAGESRGLGGEEYYGYREDLLGEVTASFARLGVPAAEHGVELVKGDFHDTLQVDQPVALAHLDGDWYESTMVCLERIAPMLVPDGRIVIDDYWAWSGCRDAVDDYFADRPGFRVEMRARVHVVRTG